MANCTVSKKGYTIDFLKESVVDVIAKGGDLYSPLLALKTDLEEELNTNEYLDIDDYLQSIKSAVKDYNQTAEKKLYFDKNIFNIKLENLTKTKASTSKELTIKDNVANLFTNKSNAYNYFINEFNNNMIEASLMNKKDSQIVDTEDKLNAYIVDLKNKLYNTLQTYLGLESKPLYDEVGNLTEEIVNYNDILSKFAVDNFSPFFTEDLQDTMIRHHLDAYNAAVTLNNFDALVSNTFSSIVKIDYRYKGFLENGNGTKYSFDEKSIETQYWKKDNHSTKAASLVSSNLIKVFTNNIPLYDKLGKRIHGQYFGMSRLYNFAALIKQLEFGNTNKSFSSNPTKLLEHYLKNYNNYTALKENADIAYSLQNYIYGNHGVADIFLDSNYKLSGNTTNIMNIEALFAFEINKVFSPSYGVYNNNTLEIKDFSNYQKVTSVVKDLIGSTIILKVPDPISPDKYKLAFDNLYNADHKVYINGTSKAVTNLDINDLRTSEFKKYFLKLTGIQLTNSLYKAISKQKQSGAEWESVAVIKKVIELTNSIAKDTQTEMNGDNNPTVIADINNRFSEDTNYNSLANAYVDTLMYIPIQSIRNSEGSEIPLYRQTSFTANDKNTIENNVHPDENFFAANPTLLKNTIIRLEGTSEESDTGKNSAKFTAEEGIFSAFFADYLSSYLNNKSVVVQPFPYSDKSTDSLKQVSINTDVAINGQLVTNIIVDAYSKLGVKIDNTNYKISKFDDTIKNINTFLSGKSMQELKALGLKDGLHFKFEGKTAKLNTQIITNVKTKLENLSIKELEHLHYYYNNTYFTELNKRMMNTWTTLIGKLPGGTKALNTKLAKLEYSDIYKLLLKNPGIELTEGLHYVVYNDKGKKKIQLNNSFLDYVKNNSTKEAFDKWNLDNKVKSLLDLNKLTDINNIFNPYNFNQDLAIIRGTLTTPEEKVNFDRTTSTSNFDTLLEFYPIAMNFSGQWVGIDFQSEQFDIAMKKLKSGSSDVIINPLIDKFIQFTNFTKDQYSSLTTKHEYLYVAKVNMNENIDIENSMRYKVLSKRMVGHPGTIQPYMQGLINGIPSKYNVSIVEDAAFPVFNYSGDFKKQDGYDGSAWMNPFIAVLENNSLPGSGIKGTKKPLGLHIGDGFSSLFKFAQFPITNSLIRNSTESENSFYEIMRKMNNQPLDSSLNFTQNLNKELFQIDDAIHKYNPEGLFVKKNGGYEKITNINLNRDINNIIDTTNKYVVVSQKTDEFGVPYGNIITKPININSVFDLWNTLGGQYSMELKDGKLEWGDLSINAVSEYMNNIGSQSKNTFNQPLKDSVVAMLANKSAVKMGATNVNIVDTWKSPENLLSFKVNTTNFGIQMDANHEADDSEITEMTQIISMLSALGYTSTYAETAYTALADIMEESLKEVDKVLADKTGKEVYKYLSKFVISEFSRANKISTAQNVIEILSKNQAIGIPFSDSSIFNLFTTNLLSKLNKDTLRRKLSGLAGILNPSHGVIQLFEDSNGRKMLWSDMLNDIYKGLENPNESDPLYGRLRTILATGEINNTNVNADLVKEYIATKFKNIQIDADKVKLFDTILVNGEEKILLTPTDIQNFTDTIKPTDIIQKVQGKARDLKPAELTWVDNLGKTQNIWTTTPLRIVTNFEQYKNSDVLKDYLEFAKPILILTNPKDEVPIYKSEGTQLFEDLQSTNKDIKSNADTVTHELLNNWTQKLFSALKNNVMYKDLVLNKKIGRYDFGTYFKGDDLVHKVDTSYYTQDNFNPIQNFVLNRAETIIPKIYKSTLDLHNDSLHEILSQGKEYFKGKLNANYEFSESTENIDAMFRTTLGNIGVMVSNKKIDPSLKENIMLEVYEDSNDVFRVDEFGEKMYKMPKDSYIIKEGKADILVVNNVNQIAQFAGSLKNKTNSIQIFGNNIKSNEDMQTLLKVGVDYNSVKYYSNKYREYGNTLESNIDNKDSYKTSQTSANIFYLDKQTNIDVIGNAIYNSFLKTQEIIAGRIPSQALQSYMSMQNVAFTETGSSDVYVSLWQIYLQGADFDIDKVYMMAYALDANGMYENWSPLFDYSSKEALDLSEKLPIPTGIPINFQIMSTKEIKGLNRTGVDLTDTIKTANGKLNHIETLNLINDLLPRINKNPDEFFYSKIADESGLMDKINQHNTYSNQKEGLKNNVVTMVHNVNMDLENQVSAYTSIDSGTAP